MNVPISGADIPEDIPEEAGTTYLIELEDE